MNDLKSKDANDRYIQPYYLIALITVRKDLVGQNPTVQFYFRGPVPWLRFSCVSAIPSTDHPKQSYKRYPPRRTMHREVAILRGRESAQKPESTRFQYLF